jgi:hypothetical protein
MTPLNHISEAEGGMSKAPTIYREAQPNGDEFVSVYGDGYQEAYVITKAQLDYMKSEQSNNKKG